MDPLSTAGRGPTTLAVDCGGGGIKASVLDAAGTMHAQPVRAATPYPLPPQRLVDTIRSLAGQLPPAERATVGMPGMIRHGVVVTTPHYVTRAGPRTKVLPDLVAAWENLDLQETLSAGLGVPVLLLNDAEVHGAGVVAGAGLELVVTLGTGLGNALFDGGRLAPHLELSRAQARWGLTYDEYIGEHERLRLGDAMWSRRVRQVVDSLRPVVLWDRLYLGGGNSRRITATTLDRLGDDVVIVPNSAGIVGGVRAWELGGITPSGPS
ncbi:polyphosphate glucokinase [Georgenia satyanarayanai]|uniref:Polyphosphate glucokinase n=1 Tax=Georgenia satyanarayanai TaxID=860221 RepID=A0A2Y9BX23_9MICO|nr:polyphosphate glucokinase [Georgenia satyanarayanai]SSA40072.1 polyphosphate glucokinase [Georgenia satyanarayanai]